MSERGSRWSPSPDHQRARHLSGDRVIGKRGVVPFPSAAPPATRMHQCAVVEVDHGESAWPHVELLQHRPVFRQCIGGIDGAVVDLKVVDDAGEPLAERISDRGIPRLGRLGSRTHRDLADEAGGEAGLGTVCNLQSHTNPKGASQRAARIVSPDARHSSSVRGHGSSDPRADGASVRVPPPGGTRTHLASGRSHRRVRCGMLPGTPSAAAVSTRTLQGRGRRRGPESCASPRLEADAGRGFSCIAARAAQGTLPPAKRSHSVGILAARRP